MQRSIVTKTAKAYVDNKFVRSESGHTYRVHTSAGEIDVVNASRKDTRDAIRAGARGATAWAASSSYLRGQILYRLAEMLEGRVDLAELAGACGLVADTDAAADLAVAFAGFTDKLGAMLGSVNSPAGFSSATEVRPVGLSCTWHAADAGLIDLVRSGCAALSAGNAVIQVVEGPAGLLACTLGEVLAVSDIPAGAWQVLPTVRQDPIVTLAGASDVKALDVVGHLQRAELETLHAEALGRARAGRHGRPGAWGLLDEIRWQVDYTSTWQPVGR